MKQFLILCISALFLAGCSVNAGLNGHVSKLKPCKNFSAGLTSNVSGKINNLAHAGVNAGLGNKQGANLEAAAGLGKLESKAGIRIGKNGGVELTAGTKEHQYGLKSTSRAHDGALNISTKIGKVK